MRQSLFPKASSAMQKCLSETMKKIKMLFVLTLLTCVFFCGFYTAFTMNNVVNLDSIALSVSADLDLELDSDESFVARRLGGRSNSAPQSRVTTLIAISVFNQYNLTKQLLYSIALDNNCRNYEIIILDDESTDITALKLRAMDIRNMRNDKPMGITHGWNRIYDYWKYNTTIPFLYILNNDIVVPQLCFESLNLGLQSNRHRSDWIGPVTHWKGMGSGAAINNLQRLEHTTETEKLHTKDGLNISFFANSNRDTLIPQFFLSDSSINRVQSTNDLLQYWLSVGLIDRNKTEQPSPKGNLGFFMGFNRGITKFEFDSHHLFDPKLINLKQEKDLLSRVTVPKPRRYPLVSLRCFVWHCKGCTVTRRHNHKTLDRDDLSAYHTK